MTSQGPKGSECGATSRPSSSSELIRRAKPGWKASRQRACRDQGPALVSAAAAERVYRVAIATGTEVQHQARRTAAKQGRRPE